MRLDVNTDRVIAFTDRLESISERALPMAVKQTLNQAAFDTKKQVPITAQSLFITRNKSFFRSLTFVNMVTESGDINKMKSEVGINSGRLPKVAEGLEAQETGGTIRDRNLIPMVQSRTSESNEKRVRKANLLKNVKISKSRRKGTGTGFIMIKKGSKGTIFSTTNRGGKRSLKPIYSYQAGRAVNVKKAPFMSMASLQSQRMLPANFIKNAERTIQRYLR